jgi:ubiquinone/menaquinone biosynthesis C-methylase UbiE
MPAPLRPQDHGTGSRTHRTPVQAARDLISAVGGSLGFDHAVEYYDETRGLSPEVQEETARVLQAELGGAGPVLDVGAGTGLVTVPLATAGVQMHALDLSERMLERLAQKARGARVRIPVVAGDATRLPYADAAFEGAVMRHVLHLVGAWRQLLSEVVRVVHPGGMFLVSITDYTGLYHELQVHFLRAAGDLPISIGLRPDDPDSLEQAMDGLGAVRTGTRVVGGRRTLTISAFLRNMQRGVYTWTWAADGATRRRAVAEVRAWAKGRFGDLHRPVEPEFEIEWRAFRLGT